MQEKRNQEVLQIMLNKILMVAFILFLGSNMLGQRCGRGEKTMLFFTLNGAEAKNLKFEMFSVTPKEFHPQDKKARDFIDKTFSPDYFQQNKDKNFEVNTSYIIPAKTPEDFLKDYNSKDFFREDKKDVFTPPIISKGKILNGTLSLITSEMFLYQYLMKISSDNYPTFYILDSHFGGCDRTEYLSLEEDGIKLFEACSKEKQCS
jgi:hypothetical protein